MSSPDEPNLDDVIVPTEEVHPDHRAHAKEGAHLDQDELDERARHEEQLVHGAEPDQVGDIPDAAE
ncbi:hypothetical protein [Williamsia deligens]|uniref:Uncharacterized protein n=1 Tax=Williamsia deligens TaxID=321325 RepID=A0ABW3G7C1_9NOCA|nr:hypothetical protein [Williamsia deligens]MCP2194480.1 hypothetical protein [Williamsia deligens]